MPGEVVPTRATVRPQMGNTAWDVVTVVHSRAGVELRLLPALHIWDFPARGQRFAYGRDEHDALSRFAQQLASEDLEGGAIPG
jgi:hypothetical protein